MVRGIISAIDPARLSQLVGGARFPQICKSGQTHFDEESLDTQSALSIAAEIGIGVAGFSSIAAAMFTRSNSNTEHAQWLQFRTLLVTSFGVTLLAYIPMVLSATALEESNTWFLASIVYFVWVLLNSILAVRDKAFLSVIRTRNTTRLFVLFTLIFVILSLSLNLYNALAVRESWPYLAALACGISIAFIQFASLLHTLWSASIKHS